GGGRGGAGGGGAGRLAPGGGPARAVLPGWCALLAGGTALTCAGVLLWGTGLLPGWAAGVVRLPARPGAPPPPGGGGGGPPA
ncbi:hypothetical protein AAHZ94_35375, partial [Streptomyces sp. HSW2009]